MLAAFGVEVLKFSLEDLGVFEVLFIPGLLARPWDKTGT